MRRFGSSAWPSAVRMLGLAVRLLEWFSEKTQKRLPILANQGVCPFDVPDLSRLYDLKRLPVFMTERCGFGSVHLRKHIRWVAIESQARFTLETKDLIGK